MTRGPKRNPRLLRAVEEMLLNHHPPSVIRAEMMRRFKTPPRTVSSYIAHADAIRAEEEQGQAKHRRSRSRATASAALARCLARAERLCDQAEELLRKARRYEKEVHDALEADGDKKRPDYNETAPPFEVDRPSFESEDRTETAVSHRRLRAKLSMARTYRAGAMELLKRGEVAEQRADGWFSQYAKVSGIYEPEVVVLGADATVTLMTSAQRREKEADLLAKLRESIAKRRAEAEAKDGAEPA
jgi:hypothetical protein